MPRINLVCSCGWNFILPRGARSHQVACPSCGRPVPIPGRRPGEEPTTPMELAAMAIWYHRRRILAMAAAAAVVLAAGVLTFRKGGDQGESVPSAQDRSPQPSDPGPRTRAPSPPPVTPLPPVIRGDELARLPAVPEHPDPAACQAEIERLIPLVNMAGIVSEALRLAGIEDVSAKLVDQMQEYESQLHQNLKLMTDAGQQFMMPAHMLPGDRIVVFAGGNLEMMPPPDAAGVISAWLRRYQAGAMENCDVHRGGEVVSILMYFPAKTKELRVLGEYAKGIKPAEPLPSNGSIVMFPVDLAKQIRERFDALPKGYRQRMTSEDVARMDKLLKSDAPRVSVTDVQFLDQRIVGQVLPRFEAEAAEIKSKAADLQPRAMQPVVTDIVYFNDGRKVEGRIESETGESVKIKLKFGSVAVPRGDIEKMEYGGGSSREFPDRMKKAEGDVLALRDLMAWCKEKKLDVQKEYVCCVLLMLNASDEVARAEMKLPK